jgi:3-hydroxyisobutyrate dehydrogenase
MHVGVIGVGRMGRPIVERLVAAGHEVDVFDADPDALLGLHAAASPRDLADRVEVLLTVLPGSPELEQVAEELGPRTPLWVDLTSADPAVAVRVAEGRSFVGAPMSGGPAAAAAGSLVLHAGGPVALVDTAAALVAPLGELRHVGDGVANGYTAKLLVNLLWFGQAVAVTEALLLGQAQGLRPEAVRAMLAESAAGGSFLRDYAPRILSGDTMPDFALARVVEELEALVGLARESRVPFELSEVVARLHRETLERFGAVDGELLATVLLQERAGRTLR